MTRYPFVSKVLAELNEFHSEVDLEFTNLPTGVSDYQLKFELKWSLDIEYRSWGVKSMSAIVPDQKLEITLEKDLNESYTDLPDFDPKKDYEDLGTEDFEVNIDLKDIKVYFKAQEDGTVMPTRLTVDFKTKTAEVEF